MTFEEWYQENKEILSGVSKPEAVRRAWTEGQADLYDSLKKAMIKYQ